MTSHIQKVGADQALSAKRALPAKLAGAALIGTLATTPAAVLFADTLLPGGGAALERLVVASAELLFLCAAFLTPGLSLPRMGDWRPAAIWLIMAWFMLTACTTLNAEIPAVAMIRQAEWVLHGIFAAMASIYLTAYPAIRRAATGAAAIGLTTAALMLAPSWSPPWSEWGPAWSMLMQSPLNGIGPDQYAYLRHGHDHPGNALLQLALEWGVAGLIIFLVAGACTLRRALAADGEGGSRRFGPLAFLGLTATGLISGSFYHSTTLLFFFFAVSLCLRLKPNSQELRGFDRDIHGLTILSAGVLLVHAILVKNLILAPVPPVGSMTAHFTRHVPMAMAWEQAGEHMNQWAVAWRKDDKTTAYELLDWTAEHSRTPQTSLRLMSQWFREDGFESEARHVLGQAAQIAKQQR